MKNIAIVVPTYNAGLAWDNWIECVLGQTGVKAKQVWVIDSSSSDDTVLKAKRAGFNTHVIKKEDFNHGATRQLALSLLPDDTEVVVFLTQDATLASVDAVGKLVAAFDDSEVGCAYGRQLAHKQAKLLGTHARLFNYPSQSYKRKFEDVAFYGIKTAFLSNSFAAYRISALREVNGFPEKVILAEDMIVAAKMLIEKYAVVYVSDALVYHSHDYTLWQEFRRYFDIGLLHNREAWLLETFGDPAGEGRRYVISEWRFLLLRNPLLIPYSMLNVVMKLLGYRLGRLENKLPVFMKRKLSMYKKVD